MFDFIAFFLVNIYAGFAALAQDIGWPKAALAYSITIVIGSVVAFYIVRRESRVTDMRKVIGVA